VLDAQTQATQNTEIPDFSFVLSQNWQDFERKVADFQAVDPRSQTFLSQYLRHAAKQKYSHCFLD
jgi:hypothetical protein